MNRFNSMNYKASRTARRAYFARINLKLEGAETRFTYTERLNWVFLPVRAWRPSFVGERDDCCGLVWKDPGLMIVGGLIDRILRAPVEGVVDVCWYHSVYRSGSLHSQTPQQNAMLYKDARS